MYGGVQSCLLRLLPSFWSISSLEPPSMARGWILPPSHFPTSLYQFLTRLEGDTTTALSISGLQSGLWRRSVHISDALQRLAQAHLISHDAAMAPRDAPTGDTLPQELYSLWNSNSTQPPLAPHCCCPGDDSLSGPATAPAQTSPPPPFTSL